MSISRDKPEYNEVIPLPENDIEFDYDDFSIYEVIGPEDLLNIDFRTFAGENDLMAYMYAIMSTSILRRS